jgi:transaldolase
MIAEGRAIASLVPEVRVKIPVNLEGLKAIKQLSSEGIECAATACNTVAMGLLAAQMGAASVISYYGVIEDFEADGSDLLEATRIAFDNYGYKTKIMFFARNAKEAKAGMIAGADGCLMTWAGLKSLVDCPLSAREILFMNSEWKRLRGAQSWCDIKNK